MLLAVATIWAAVGAAVTSTRLAASALAPVAEAPADNWLKGLSGKYKQFFDFPSTNGGIPLVHMLNYYDTYNKAYGVPDRDIDAVGTFYGSTTFHALNDAMWAKYQLGEFLKENDPSGQPATSVRGSKMVHGVSAPPPCPAPPCCTASHGRSTAAPSASATRPRSSSPNG